MEKFPIGLTGKAGAGKDFVKDIILNKYSKEFKAYSFADPIRKMATDIFMFHPTQFSDPALKEKMDTYWGISPRSFMQFVGFDLFKEQFRSDVWIRLAELFIETNPDKHIVVTDVRMNDEADMIHNGKGVVIAIEGRNKDIGSRAEHKTESGIENFRIDYTIINDCDEQELEKRVCAVIDKILKKGEKDA